MSDKDPRNALNYRKPEIEHRAIDELIGLSRGLLADGMINQAEAEFLHKWLAANHHISDNPVIGHLLARIEEMLADNFLDDDEAEELFNTLERFTGNNFEFGEILKSTSLPVNDPLPPLEFEGKRFCFTGTFAYGKRKECEKAVIDLGAEAGPLTKKTDYLVIGVYATDSWKHSSYGRKIEKAAADRDAGHPIALIPENYWLQHIENRFT